jgi:hypothetical protein
LQLRTITLAMTLVLAGILAAQGDTKGPARTGGGVSGGQIGPAAGIVSGREAVLLGPATRENYCIYRDPDTQRTWEARCTSD